MALLVLTIAGLTTSPAHAEAPLYEKGAIRLYTDAGPEAAATQLTALTALQSQLEDYWGRKLQGTLTCYWVTDLATWPADTNPLPAEAREKLKLSSAVTLTERASLDGKVVAIESIVYASRRPIDLHHELVHAFCWQTFGRCGPDWYSEGMAEVFANAASAEAGVAYYPWAIEYLHKQTKPPSPAEIMAGPLPKAPLWQTYAHRWALCYLLSQHPRYAQRFRQFGQQLLAQGEADFAKEFADIRPQLDTDYRHFLQEIKAGYRFPPLAD